MIRIRALVVALLCASLAACGSTVQVRGTVAGQGPELGGLDGSTSGSSTSGTGGSTGVVAPGTTTTGVSSLPDGQGTSAPTAEATTGGTTTGGTATSTTGGAVGGGRHTPIKVGVLAVDYSGLASQFGVSFPTNYFDVYKNLFSYLNRHGGIAGHPVQAIYHTANGAAANRATEDQTSCTYFTEDNHVQVVLSEIIYEPAFAACLKKKGVAQIDNGQYGLTQHDLDQLPNVISPEGLTLEREAAIEFAGMTARGILKKGSVVGVIVGGCADEVAAYNSSVVPLAKQYGLRIVQNQLACYGGAAGLAAATSQIQGAVLKFRSANVGQVFAFTASEGYVLTVFMSQASSQGFHPGYLLTSNGYPYANTASEGTASYPDDARPSLHGMGWAPFYDANGKPAATGAQLAAQKRCATMDPTYGGAKTAKPPADINEMQLFYSTCDDVLMLAKVLESNGLNTSVAALRSGFQGLSFVGAGAYGGAIKVTAKHGDGAALAAPFSWKAGCSCMTVDGPPMAIPG